MDYFKDMMKNTKVFMFLIFLSSVVSLPISYAIQEYLQAGLMLSFITSYIFGVVIVFVSFFIYAIRKENMINNGY